MSEYLNQVERKIEKVSFKYYDLLPECINTEVDDFAYIKGTALPWGGLALDTPRNKPSSGLFASELPYSFMLESKHTETQPGCC